MYLTISIDETKICLLQWLTGGTLISRDKDFIVLYRGKDFLPSAVSSAIQERRRQTTIEKSSAYANKLAATDDTELEAEYKRDHIQTHQTKPRQRKSPEAILERTSIKLSMVCPLHDSIGLQDPFSCE